MEYITQTNVLTRTGWTKTLLNKLLGAPDLQKKVYGRSNLSNLYLIERVLESEKSQDYLDVQEKIAKRKASAVKAVETKIKKLLASIDVMKVGLVQMDVAKVRKRAIYSYNDYHDFSDNPASEHSDQQFLDRICVNYCLGKVILLFLILVV